MQKIFFNEKVLILSGEKPASQSSSIDFNEFIGLETRSVIQKLGSGKFGSELFIWGEQPDIMLSWMENNVPMIKAGGGLVQNPRNEILFIFRKNQWDLPKGKPEGNETIEETAMREVTEECGISDLKIISPLLHTYHFYLESNGSLVLKKSIWFHMLSSGLEQLRVQTEEQITDARWISPPVPKKILNNAYLSIRELVKWFQKHYRP